MSHRFSERSVLAVEGPPDGGNFGRGVIAQLLALSRNWCLVQLPGVSVGSASESKCSLFESIYRFFDRQLYARRHWRLPTAADLPPPGKQEGDAAGWRLAWTRDALPQPSAVRLCVEYDGLPMMDLERAVRGRLGHPGGTVCARVWRLDPPESPKLLMVGRLRLDHRSLHRSVMLCAAKLPDLLRAGMARLDRPMRAEPSSALPAHVALSAARQIGGLVRTSLQWLLWREQWQLELGRFAGGVPHPGPTTVVLRPPDSAFWADPFLLRRGSRTWVIFEELPFKTQRGHISVQEIDHLGKPLSAPQVVLKEAWHLSYPFVWQEDSRVFMIPEAGRSNKVTLYEAVGDDLNWQRRATLVDGQRLADATVARYGGRLWMFATGASDGVGTMDDCLHVFWADRIEGPWFAHALNPVKIDAGSSRPAGSMWVADGVLYRLAQDCSSTYGGSIRCMRVTRLTEDEFDEEPVEGWACEQQARSSDPWHTFNFVGDMTVIDRLVRLPRWRTL